MAIWISYRIQGHHYEQHPQVVTFWGCYFGCLVRSSELGTLGKNMDLGQGRMGHLESAYCTWNVCFCWAFLDNLDVPSPRMRSHFTRSILMFPHIYNEKACEDSISYLDLCLCDSYNFELYSWVRFFILDLYITCRTHQ